MLSTDGSFVGKLLHILLIKCFRFTECIQIKEKKCDYHEISNGDRVTTDLIYFTDLVELMLFLP